jgi:hypothetical protein
MERLLDGTASPPPTLTVPENDRAKRDTNPEPSSTRPRVEVEPTHLAMPLHRGSPGIAGIDPLERYERRALSRRNRAVQKFLEMFGVSTRSAHERVDPTGARRTI